MEINMQNKPIKSRSIPIKRINLNTPKMPESFSSELTSYKDYRELHRNGCERNNTHNTLTRTISHPQTQEESNMTSMVNSLIENIGNLSLHRKLERTQSEPLPQQINASRYKTELCRPFEEAGECKYGEKCQFAHGYHELRNLQRHPKYKTEYCRTYHSVGICPYGPRCHFVHNADEARASQQATKPKDRMHSSVVGKPLPLSPPLSMSTGSDRESPTGSISLSPSSSMANFQYTDQVSPTASLMFASFSYGNTPPESPNAQMSPVNTPPPSIVLNTINNKQAMCVKPVTLHVKQILQKSSSSPIAATNSTNNKSPTKVSSASSLTADELRLPIFNKLSSAVECFPCIDI